MPDISLEEVQERLYSNVVEQYSEQSSDINRETVDVEINVGGSRSNDFVVHNVEIESPSVDYRENIRTGHGPRFINRSQPITDMDAPTQTAFVYEKAIERTSEQTVAQAYAGNAAEPNGTDGVKWVLFMDTHSRITEDIEQGSDHVTAFNRFTEDWPHTLRAEYAAHEYHRGRDGDDNYRDEVERFAESEGVLDMEFTQTELDTYYNPNPFNDDELSDEEASVVLTARHYDVDNSKIDFDEIGNLENFKWWLKETQDVDESLRAHHYGTDVSTEIISQAAAPSAWDSLDPDNIERRVQLERGGETAYYIHHHQHGETWVDETGPFNGTRLGGWDSRFVDVTPDQSAERVVAQSHLNGLSFPETFVVYDGDTVVKLERDSRLVKQVENRAADLDAPTFDVVRGFAGEGDATIQDLDLVRLEPQDGPGSNAEQQRSLLQTIIDDPPLVEQIFDGGPVFIRKREHVSGSSYSVNFDRFQPSLARDVKEALESPQAI